MFWEVMTLNIKHYFLEIPLKNFTVNKIQDDIQLHKQNKRMILYIKTNNA